MNERISKTAGKIVVGAAFVTVVLLILSPLGDFVCYDLEWCGPPDYVSRGFAIAMGGAAALVFLWAMLMFYLLGTWIEKEIVRLIEFLGKMVKK